MPLEEELNLREENKGISVGPIVFCVIIVVSTVGVIIMLIRKYQKEKKR